MKKNDLFIVIFGILLCAVSILIIDLTRVNGDTVLITVNGKIHCEKPLEKNCEIDINGSNTAVIENGEVYMKSADCKDRLCIHQGKIHDSSKKIICLPNKVVISVTKKSETDSVVR